MNNKKFNKLNNLTEDKMLNLYEFLNKKEFLELAERMNIDDIKIQREGELLKFRRWKSNWELPKELKIKEEIVKYGASRKSQNIIKRSMWAKIETLENFKKRWSKKQSPRYWGNQAKIPYRIENEWVWCKIHNNWIFDFDIKSDFLYKEGWIYFKIPKNHIGASYQSKDLHNNFVLIPSKIKSDNFFFEGLGLQQGDGTHSLSDVHITFTNGCYELIEHQLKWFNNLGINLNSIRIYPEIPKDQQKTFEEIKEKLISLGVKEYQFRKRKSKLINTKNVLIQLVFHNKLFKVIYLFVLKELKKDILFNKNYIQFYFRGLIAAEGCVRTRSKDGVLNDIKISATNEKFRSFIKSCFLKIGIVTCKDELTEGSEAVVVRRYENFLKLNALAAFNLHPKKQEKFIKGFKNYKNKGVNHG